MSERTNYDKAIINQFKYLHLCYSPNGILIMLVYQARTLLIIYFYYFFLFLGPRFGMRHLQALLIFLNIVVVYFSRINVSVSVVAMTNANTTNPNFPVRGFQRMNYFLAFPCILVFSCTQGTLNVKCNNILLSHYLKFLLV